MSGTIADLLQQAAGVRLDQSQNQKDFDANLWRVDGADSWKLERMQSYSEAGFPGGKPSWPGTGIRRCSCTKRNGQV